MGKFFLSLLLTVAMCATSDGQIWNSRGYRYYSGQNYSGQQAPAAVDPLNRLVDGHTQYNIGRSGLTPTGVRRPYVTLTLSDGWENDPNQRAVLSWFATNPRLAALKKDGLWNLYTTGNPHFRDQLMRSYGNDVPIFTIQQGGQAGSPGLGKLLMNVSRQHFPRTSGELADLADIALEQSYAPPRVGDTDFTPIEREVRGGSVPGDAGFNPEDEDCGPDCHPKPLVNPLTVPDQEWSRMPEVVPSNAGGLMAVASLIGTCVIVGGIVVGAFLVSRSRRTSSLY